MFYYRINTANGKLPLRVKIGLVFGIIAGLAILAIFAFGFFIVALCAGLVLFIANLFMKPGRRPPHHTEETVIIRRHRPRPSDHDVIDI